MFFRIQVSNPKFLKVDEGDSTRTLGEAISSVFPEWTEQVFMNWNGTEIPIDHWGVTAYIIDDVLEFLTALLDRSEGTHTVEFHEQDWEATWSASWSGEQLRIEAQWEVVPGGIEAVLNSNKVLEIPKQEFLAEWKMLLRKLLEAIRYSGIKIEFENELRALESCEERIIGFGQLYR